MIKAETSLHYWELKQTNGHIVMFCEEIERLIPANIPFTKIIVF